MRRVNPSRSRLSQSILTLLCALTIGVSLAAIVQIVSAASVAASVNATLAASPDVAGLTQSGSNDSSSDGPQRLTRHLTVVAGLEGVQFRADSATATSRIIPSGSVLRATGRSDDGQWLYVTVDSELGEAETGWVATEDVIAFGVDAIPVLDGSGAAGESEPTAATDSESASSDASTSASAPSSLRDSNPSEPESSTTNSSEPESSDTSTIVEIPVADTVTANVSRLNVRSGPGTQYSVAAQVTQADEMALIGQSQDGSWIQVVVPESDGNFSGETIGWVAAAFVNTDVPRANLATVAAPAVAPAAPESSETGSSESGSSDAGSSEPSAANSAASGGSTVNAGPAGLSGTLVFQQSIGGQLYAYNLSSGALWPLTTGAEPALSPDGSTVAFTRTDGLYLINIDGSDERRIFSGREGLGSPKWSPDGETLIFTRGDEWQACQKFGSRERCTEDNEVGEGKYRKIMYAIAAVEADGSNYRDVVSTKPARAPDWTADGIIYQSIDGLQQTTVDRDAVNTLIDYDYLDPFYYDPDRQPGGNQIVFESNEGSHWQIFTINSDGSGRRALTRPLTALVDQLPSSVAPAFSPDGRQIVFVSNRTSSGEAGEWTLWVMNADGSNQRPLPININVEYTFGVEQVVSWR